ncbi:MAG: aminotransferase class I/II-fold pyridoxal phosphate-dependent enzyme [Cyclobacteriaceae bacterium]|nr:aminotransferase class I/II-fold pyridoxal phosphate-dependent enzyme [Cyclobacteriaceae bacterium]
MKNPNSAVLTAQDNKPFIDKRLYHLFENNKLDYLIFDQSDHGEIDADKYTLYNLTADKRIENTLFENRLDMMDSWLRDMNAKKHGLYARESLSGCKAVLMVRDPFDGSIREMLNMASNDYLNLTQHPRIAEKVYEYTKLYGGGSGGAPMLNGTSSVTKMLENKIASIKGCESAIVFSSGYGANIGAITSLLGKNDLALYDMYAHASLIDGSHKGTPKFFKHNDPESLKGVLDALGDTFLNKIVIVDGVYSMDGDIAKLDEIIDIAHFMVPGCW